MANSLHNGYNSSEFYFAAITARNNKIKKVLSVAVTGNNARIICRNLEGLIVNNNNNTVKGDNII